MSLSGPEYRHPANSNTRQAVIFLHGYGADGHDLIGLAPQMGEALPGTVFYSPHAPEPCEMSPSGRQWFSLASYDPDMMRREPETMSPIHTRLLQGARTAAPYLQNFMDSITEKEKIPLERIALVGFSQGSMMAMHVALRQRTSLAAVVGFSGALVGAEVLPNEVTSRPPVLLVHGDADPVVPYLAMELAERALRENCVDVGTVTCQGLPHGIDEYGLCHAIRFLKQRFTPKDNESGHLHDLETRES
ncbi:MULTISPECIES: alpha/beta hydrolase [unclassified Haematospirillum]|uniref:alpha/beta hydrolase n=1 Tax=unclassified Haematospirillum TaxID=2622088 RepID=UPI00143B7CBB|nr:MULTISPECIES: alpha/beta fold hydrolase [unclassified Haematospirillum]NKD54409.1 phospholipase [Haematospirillum sp. H4890]NKD74452.1 phospholipase [Haematospirillum sp. H4485]